MILSHINTKDEDIKQKLLLKDTPTQTWEAYLKQYLNGFDLLLGYAKNSKEPMDTIYMPFMFIFRHSVELLLKKALETHNQKYSTHNLSELYQNIYNGTNGHTVYNEQFKDNLKVLNWDTLGDEFRYNVLEDWKNVLPTNEIDAYTACSYFSNFMNLGNKIPVGNQRLHYKFTFHITEKYLGQIRTQYDKVLMIMLNEIVKGIYSIDDIFLPVMFCLRHGLELALKDMLRDYEDDAKEFKKHSLQRIQNKVDKFLNVAIANIPKDEVKLIYETNKAIGNWNQLRPSIEKVDATSFSFRFPDMGLSVEKDLALSSIELYQNVDSFLTFAVLGLAQCGYLQNK